jgi:hypothetical protein
LNAVSIAPATPHDEALTERAVVNGIALKTGSTLAYGRQALVEQGLGVEITVYGPLAHKVAATFSRSPLAVLRSGRDVAVPLTWKTVTFASLSFSVPPHWHLYYTCTQSAETPCSTSAREVGVIARPTVPQVGTQPFDSTLRAPYIEVFPNTARGPYYFPPNDTHGYTWCELRVGIQLCFDFPLTKLNVATWTNTRTTARVISVGGEKCTVVFGLTHSGLTDLRIYDSLRPAKA